MSAKYVLSDKRANICWRIFNIAYWHKLQSKLILFYCMAFVVSIMTVLASNPAHADKVYEYLQADKVYEYFAGTTNVANATVRINETLGVTNSDGSFSFHTKKADRYVISVSKIGYALVSRIETQPSASLTFTLKKADVIPLSIDDLTKGITVQDSRKTEIQLPPNAFGDSVNEPVNAYVYTYDIANEAMPGDMSVANSDGYLESAGVFSAEFIGTTSGKKYNLAVGKEATISLPSSITTDLPGLWHYDEVTGKWEEGNSSSVNLVNGRLQGKVAHFSVWNFDWKFIDPACLLITIDSSFSLAYGNNAIIKTVVKSNIGTRSREGQLNDGTLQLINIPSNSQIDIYVRSAATNNAFVLLAANVNSGASVSSRWVCNGNITLGGKPLISAQDTLAVITGTGVGTPFSWLLTDQTGNVIANNSSVTVNGNSATVAMQLFMNMIQTDGTLMSSGVVAANNTLSIGNNILYVGTEGQTDPAQMCQVSLSAPCAFNPMIQLFPKTQLISTISGFIWRDVDGNGLQGIGEKIYRGITVKLSPSNLITATDENGYYKFSNLSSGTYTVSLGSNVVQNYTTSKTVTRTVDNIYTNANSQPSPLANFGIKDVYSIYINVVGRGVVNANGVSCDSLCLGFSVTSGYGINLNVTPASGYSFVEWTGDCASNSTNVSVVMDADKNCTVNLVSNDTGNNNTGSTTGGSTGDNTNNGTDTGNTTTDNTDSNTGGTILSGFDGNGDGIVDSQQNNVVSLSNTLVSSSGTETTDNVNVTLEASNGCALKNVQIKRNGNLSVFDNRTYPYGLVEFEAACPETRITLFYHLDASNDSTTFNSVFSDTNSGWYSLANTTAEFTKVGDKGLIKLSFNLKDGELGDNTGVDGKIVNISGLAVTDKPQACAQVITYAQNSETKECKEFATACVDEGWNVISSEAYQTCNASTPKDIVNLWIRDPNPDDGTEPGKATQIWASPAVWVRNVDDDGNAYQNVKYGQDNYVYVQVRNIGTLPAENTKVEVYRSGASMGQSWPRGWALVGTAEISSIEPQTSQLSHIKWEKDNIPTPGHYCFYVRVLNDQDPMFSPETTNMVSNTRINNNIAWRNFNVVGFLTQVTNRFQVNVGNPNSTTTTVDVVFDEKAGLLQNDGSAAIVNLGDVLFQRWQQAGGQGENVKVLNGTEVQLLATPAKLIGIELQADEQLPIEMRVDAFKPAPGEGTERHYQFSAQEVNSTDGSLIGGVDYDMVTRAQDTDSDGDGIKDVVDTDNDNDGIDDESEIEYGLNPLDSVDATADLDGDGQSNVDEINAGTDPTDPSSKITYYTTHGTLLDKAGNPIANATVQVGNKTTMTDELGNWSIDGLFEGKYDIVATKDNFNCLNTDFELGNNDYHQVVDCEPVTSLKMLVKPSNYTPVEQEGTLTYAITVVNGGEQTATGVTLANLLSEGASLVALESVEGQCDTENLVCTLSDLPKGHSAVVKLTVRADQANALKTKMTLTSNEYPIDVKQNFRAVKPYLSTNLACTPNPVVMQSSLHCQAVVELSALAPEDTATEIKLNLQLAKGVELVDVITEYGNCDSSAFPAITCQLSDLSVASADSISRAVVDINVTLTDASLLILTNEAKVSATNYPDHTDRERTEIVIPPNAIADITFAIDTTVSMVEEFNALIKGVEQFILEQVGATHVMPKVLLIEIKDEVKKRYFGSDMNEFLKSVRSLKVEGGGLCPEASAEALKLANEHTKEDGVIFLGTDAPPYPDTEADIEAFKQQVIEKRITFIAPTSIGCTVKQDF